MVLDILIELSRIQQSLNRLLAEHHTAYAKVQALQERIDKEKRALDSKQQETDRTYQEALQKLEQEKGILVGLELQRKATQNVSNKKFRDAQIKDIENKRRVHVELIKQIEDVLLRLSQESKSTAPREGNTQALAEETQEFQQHLQNILQRQNDLRQEFQSLSAQVEPKTMLQFDRLAQKYIDPVVEVIDRSCSGCALLVAPQELIRIRQRLELTTCRSCGRFLYDTQESTES